MKIKNLFLGLASITLATTPAVVVASCGNKSQAKSVEIVVPGSRKTIAVNEEMTLTLKTDPETTTSKFNWDSSDQSVVSVDNNGKIKGEVEGTATITVKSADNEKVKAEVVFTVQKTVVTIAGDAEQYTKNGATIQLTATCVSPTGNNEVTWESSTHDILDVDQSGKVTCKNIGYGWILAKAKDGSGELASVKIYVFNDFKTVTATWDSTNNYFNNDVTAETYVLYDYTATIDAAKKKTENGYTLFSIQPFFDLDQEYLLIQDGWTYAEGHKNLAPKEGTDTKGEFVFHIKFFLCNNTKSVQSFTFRLS